MKEFWDETDHAGFNLTSLNLRDQAERLKKKIPNDSWKKSRKFVQNQKDNGADNFGINGEFQELDLQIESPKSQILEEPPCTAINTETRKIVQLRIANNVPLSDGYPRGL